MTPAKATSPEPAILRARAQGEVSAEAAYDCLYAAYAGTVRAWLVVRAGSAHAEDLFQDVWTIFFGRWKRWQILPEMMAPEARPVLSFLFRTAHLVLLGHRRATEKRQHNPIEGVDVADTQRGPQQLEHKIQLGDCLRLAQQICPLREFEVLTAKLAGVPAREIARTLGLTEPVVDHHFRDAIARMKKKLAPRGRKGGQRNG